MHDETPEGLYLYCIIRGDAARAWSARGIGERGDAVFSIAEGGLAAVVSGSPVVEYDNTRRNMMAHTIVLEEVMRDHTILPVRFGIVAPSEAAVRQQLLVRRADELRRRLDEMDGHVELGLKAMWFENTAFGEVITENAAIRALRDRLANRAPEESYYERIKLGELVEQALGRKREADSHAILAALRPVVAMAQVNPVISDRMVLNAAFLVAREREADFDRVIQALDAAMGSRMMFKYVGPVPPYNFVNLVVRWE
jgi:hypothetical protein